MSGGAVFEEEWRRGRLVPEGERWRGSRSQRGRVALRMPQVVVRITGKSRGAAKVWGRLWYVSHEGELSLEREDGTRVEGRAEIEKLLNQWSVHFDPRRNGRDAVQLSFSVPESEVEATPEGRERVLDAVRQSARAEWGSSHPFVLAAHTNSSNYHVHVIVRSRGYAGEPLPSRKADLERWRDRFAGACRERGLWVDASPRWARGQQRSLPTPVYRKLERGEALRSDAEPARSAARVWEEALRKRNALEREQYAREGVNAIRSASGLTDGAAREKRVELGIELVRYAVEMPFERPRSEELRSPFQLGDRLEDSASIGRAVLSLGGQGSAAVSSDSRGWVSLEEAAERSASWGSCAEEVLFVLEKREYVSARDQGRAAVGFVTAALRSAGITEYALRADVEGEAVRIWGVVSDGEGRLSESLDRIEERFLGSATRHGYPAHALEERPGLEALVPALQEVHARAAEALAPLPSATRSELSRELREVLNRVPALAVEREDREADLDEDLER